MEARTYFKKFEQVGRNRFEAILCEADEAQVADVAFLKSEYDALPDDKKAKLEKLVIADMKESCSNLVFQEIYHGKNLVKFQFGAPKKSVTKSFAL